MRAVVVAVAIVTVATSWGCRKLTGPEKAKAMRAAFQKDERRLDAYMKACAEGYYTAFPRTLYTMRDERIVWENFVRAETPFKTPAETMIALIDREPPEGLKDPVRAKKMLVEADENY